MGKTRKALSGLGFLAALLFVGQVQAAAIKITVTTTALNGQMPDLAFDLIDGGSPDNSVTIFDFSITGGTLNGVPTLVNNATGDLSVPGGTAILNDYDPVSNSGFNEYLQNAKLGSLLTFSFVTSGDTASSASNPDAFSFFFLDPITGFPLFSTSDQTGANAIFLYNIGEPNPLEVYNSEAVTVQVDEVISGVPEPGALALAMAGLLALGVVRSVRNHPLGQELRA